MYATEHVGKPAHIELSISLLGLNGVQVRLHYTQVMLCNFISLSLNQGVDSIHSARSSAQYR